MQVHHWWQMWSKRLIWLKLVVKLENYFLQFKTWQRSFLCFVRNALPNMYFSLLHHCGMTYRNELCNTKHMKHTSPTKIHHHLKGFVWSSKFFASIIQCSKCIGYSLSKKWFHICNNKGKGIHVCCFLTCSFCIHFFPIILWIMSCNQTQCTKPNQPPKKLSWVGMKSLTRD